MTSVTIITPTLRRRVQMLRRAQMSVRRQTVPVEHRVIMDRVRQGPSALRNQGIREATTEWVGFLDDDDELYPRHVERCLAVGEETGADLVYPWFDIKRSGRIAGDFTTQYTVAGQHAFGLPWSDAHEQELLVSNFIPVTVLVRRETLLSVGGFVQPRSPEWPHSDCEDWGTWQRLLTHGAKFAHVPERTWAYHWHGRNSSGQPDKARRLRLV